MLKLRDKNRSILKHVVSGASLAVMIIVSCALLFMSLGGLYILFQLLGASDLTFWHFIKSCVYTMLCLLGLIIPAILFEWSKE